MIVLKTTVARTERRNRIIRAAKHGDEIVTEVLDLGNFVVLDALGIAIAIGDSESFEGASVRIEIEEKGESR